MRPIPVLSSMMHLKLVIYFGENRFIPVFEYRYFGIYSVMKVSLYKYLTAILLLIVLLKPIMECVCHNAYQFCGISVGFLAGQPNSVTFHCVQHGVLPDGHLSRNFLTSLTITLEPEQEAIRTLEGINCSLHVRVAGHCFATTFRPKRYALDNV